MFSDCSLSDRFVTPLILAMLSIIFSIVMDYGIYKAVQHYKRCDDDNKPPKSFFIIGLFLVMMSSITMMIFSIILIIGMIHCNQEIKVSNWIFSISYAFQIYCLHLLWLNRLKFVFHDTIYRISSFISFGYIICLLITWILAMFLLIFVPFISRWIIYSSLYALSAIFLMILIFIFIYKLQQLYNATNNGRMDNNKDLISLITKTIILAFISIFCTLMLSLVMIINIWIDIVYTLLLIDIISNALCVMLTYSYYDNTYYKLCGCLHNKCLSIYLYHQENKRNHHDIIQNTNNMIKLAVKDEEFENKKENESIPQSPINRITILKQLSIASILAEHKSIKLSISKCKSPSKSHDTLIMDYMSSPMSDLIISTIHEMEEESDDKSSDFIQHSMPISTSTIISTAL